MFTTFRGGQSGPWRVTAMRSLKGEPLPPVRSLSVVHSQAIALPLQPSAISWRLAGTTSDLRYVERAEKERLAEVPAGLAGRKRAARR